MTTARYLVKLSYSKAATCLVERQLTRDDQGRAVSYAQNWLLKTQRLSLYAGITYDMYEIYKKDDSGQWVNVETGSVLDAETGRAKDGKEKDRPATPPVAATKSRVARTKRARERDDPRGDLFVTDKLPRAPKQRFGRKAKSPLQQRIAEMQAIALQTLADRKEKGNK